MEKSKMAVNVIFVAASVVLFLAMAVAQVNQVNQTVPQVGSPGQGLSLNFNISGHPIHVHPTVDQVKAIAHNGGTPPLLYNGGPVMLTATVYAIFWAPPQLQDGSSTSLSAGYQNIQTNMLKEYFGHSLSTNNTQYYQGPPSFAKAYIKGTGKLGGAYVDTSLYPGKDCSDPALTTPTNCITDTDLQNEIKKVMSLKGWTGGLNKMFLLFTSSGEGSCAGTGICSYNYYCAYHGYFVNSLGQDVVYSNEPYGDINFCQATGAPSPNGNRAADAAATAASHELTEAITDPLINAWQDSTGNEIGDECAYYYGNVGYNGGTANELWDGKPFLLQTEYSNNLSNFYISDINFTGCFNAGPEL